MYSLTGTSQDIDLNPTACQSAEYRSRSEIGCLPKIQVGGYADAAYQRSAAYQKAVTKNEQRSSNLMTKYPKRTVKPVTKKSTKKTVKKVVKKRSFRRSVGKQTTRQSSVFEEDTGEGHRLQKILAVAGFGSRRQCEELIEQGRVEVDGSIAQLGCKAELARNEIKVDGERLKKSKPIYLALFKPKGYICTDLDQQGRVRTIDLIPPSFGRLFLIGRLDRDSEGLILLTNDGALSERLTHPRYGVPKVYRVQVAGDISQDSINQLRKGVYLAEGFAKATEAVIKGRHKQSSIIDLTLSEGMNREIRRLLARLGHKVMTLIRISVGPVKLGKLEPGEWRHLTRLEVDRLYTAGKNFSQHSSQTNSTQEKNDDKPRPKR